MKLKYNNDTAKLCVIEFDDNDSQEFKDKLAPYHMGGGAYKLTKEELEKLRSKIETVYIWKTYSLDNKRPELPKMSIKKYPNKACSTEVYIDKLELNLCEEYNNYEEFCRKLIKAEVSPQLPLHYYPSDTKEFAIKLIQEKVPSSFMYRRQLIDFVEYRECESYDLSKELSMFSCLLGKDRLLKFMPDMYTQAEVNRIIINIVRDLYIMF